MAASGLTREHLATLDVADPDVVEQIRVLCALNGGPRWSVDIVEYDRRRVPTAVSVEAFFPTAPFDIGAPAEPGFDAWLCDRLLAAGHDILTEAELRSWADGEGDLPPWNGRLASGAEAIGYIAPGGLLDPPVFVRDGEGDWTVWTAGPLSIVWRRTAVIRAVAPDRLYVQRSLA